MSDLALIDAPPCPHCGRAVDVLASDPAQDDYLYGTKRWAVASFPLISYTLQPCGHVVHGLTHNYEGTRVLEWLVRH